MAPMVDMVFLLLVFFMCVTAVTGGRALMQLDLPQTLSASAAAGERTGGTAQPQIVLSLGDKGELSVNGVLIAPVELTATLRRLRASAPSVDLSVRIRADAGVPYRRIEKLLLACAEAGISKISYAAHEAQIGYAAPVTKAAGAVSNVPDGSPKPKGSGQ